MDQKIISRVAGFSILAMAAVAGFGYGYAFKNLYMAAGLRHLNNENRLLTSVILSFTLIAILDIIVTWALYALFKKVSASLSLITALLRLIYTLILGKAILSLCPLNAMQNEELLMEKMTLFLNTWSCGLIIFGAHLFLLGIMLKRPKILVYLACAAGACYMLTNVAQQLWPSYEQYKDKIDMILALPMALGELALAVWLICNSWKKEAGFS